MGARIGPCAAARAAGDGLGQTRRSCPPSVKGRASDAIALDYADCGKLGDLGRVVDRAFVGKARARHDRGATGADDAGEVLIYAVTYGGADWAMRSSVRSR